MWSIPQGEDATRRHLRDGLKAGDTDPVTARVILNYHDPMVPGKNFDAPAKSPFMDMMLVPRYAGSDAADASSVTVSPRIQQNLGLRSAVAEAAALAVPVSAVGSVVWNERDQVLLQARATGYVERLHVRATLDRVASGAPLADIYVPAWVAAQEDYLALARMSGPDLADLRDAARQRMRLVGMDPAQIERVVQQGSLQPRFTLVAPIGGVVTELALREGATVMAGMTLVRIQGTATVWADGELPESQAALLQPGTPVSATSPAAPGQRFDGRVQALLPAVDPATRTLKARLELRNPGGRLVPGMFVQMQFQPAARAATVLVPSEAVIRTGRRSLVMLAEADGRFRPVEVTLGAEAGGRTEVTRRPACRRTGGAVGPVPDRFRSQPARPASAAGQRPGACRPGRPRRQRHCRPHGHRLPHRCGGRCHRRRQHHADPSADRRAEVARDDHGLQAAASRPAPAPAGPRAAAGD